VPPALRKWSTRVAFAGAAITVLAAVLFGFALANGVHCPECDARELGDRYAAWKTFFNVKDALWVAGLALSVLGTPLANRRLPGIFGVLVALIGITLQPR
jgi:hypothetical protein